MGEENGLENMTYQPYLTFITIALEIFFFFYTLNFPGRKKIIRTTGLLFILLASYQILELLICYYELYPAVLSKIVFMVISYLPPLGVLLIYFVRNVKSKVMKYYAVGLFVAVFTVNLFVLFV